MSSLFFGTRNLGDYDEVETALKPLESDGGVPRLTMDRCGTLGDFTTVVLRALRVFQGNIIKRDKKTWVPLLAGYPHASVQKNSNIQMENLKTLEDYYFLDPFCNLVTYTLKYQSPAGSQKAFGSEKMRPPTLRKTIPVEGQPGVYMETWAAVTDNLVQFDCWSSSGRGADKLADWFKYFMQFMKGPIMQQGFQKIEFWEREIDNDVTQWREDIAVRSLRYLVRTEEQFIKPTGLITQIDAAVAVRSSLNDEEEALIRTLKGIPASGYIQTPDVSISGMPDLMTNIELVEGGKLTT
jgi:hypothetical protein